MAFPQVETTSSYNSGANSVSHALTLPTGITEGDLILIAASRDGAGEFALSGYDLIFDGIGINSVNRLAVWVKKAGASESNPTITLSNTDGLAAVLYRISGWADIKVGPGWSDLVATVECPAFDMGDAWGEQDYLVIAVAGWDDGIALTSYPTGYDDNQVSDRWDSATLGVGIALSTKESTSQSVAQADYTLSASDQAMGVHVIVRPAYLASESTFFNRGIRSGGRL